MNATLQTAPRSPLSLAKTARLLTRVHAIRSWLERFANDSTSPYPARCAAQFAAKQAERWHHAILYYPNLRAYYAAATLAALDALDSQTSRRAA